MKTNTDYAMKTLRTNKRISGGFLVVGIGAIVAAVTLISEESAGQSGDCPTQLAYLDDRVTKWANRVGATFDERPSGNVKELNESAWFRAEKLPVCPEGGVYTLGTSFRATECSEHGIGLKYGELSSPSKWAKFKRDHLRNPFVICRRFTGTKNTCVANLKQLDGAKQQWAIDEKKSGGDTPMEWELLGPSLYIKRAPVCPEGGKYRLGKVRENPRCTVAGHSLQ